MIRVQIPTTRMIPAIRMILKNLYPPEKILENLMIPKHREIPMCPEERIPANPGRKKKPKRKKSLKIPRPKKTEIHDGGIRLPQEGSKREFYQDIGMKIRAYRKKSGMRQGELAGLAGISTSAVSNLEKGKPMVTVYTLGRIAEALGIGMGEMFQGSPGTGRDDPLYSRFISLYESLEGYDDLQKERILSDLTMLLKDLPLRL